MLPHPIICVEPHLALITNEIELRFQTHEMLMFPQIAFSL